VATLEAATEASYAALVARAPASPITHTLLWREVLEALGLGTPVYWLASRGGEVRAALPAFVRTGPEGAVLNSLPLVQSTGGVITGPDCSAGERAELVGLLTGTMLAWAAGHDVRVACVIGSPYRGEADLPALPRPPDFRVLRTTNVLDLAAPLEPRPSILWTVRKAERLGPVHRLAATLAEARAVHELYAASMRRLEVTPHPWALFEPLFRAGAGRFVWAEVGGEMVSCLILLVHREVIDYHSVGNSEAGRRLQTNSWLCHEELQRAQAAGLRWWNWGASPSAAVHDFKKRWGGRDLAYPIWGWTPGDVAPWRRLTPRQLAAAFPSYFVLPYDQLQP
jgi:hypothetical protein